MLQNIENVRKILIKCGSSIFLFLISHVAGFVGSLLAQIMVQRTCNHGYVATQSSWK